MSSLIVAAYPIRHITDLKSYIYQPAITKQDIASFARCCIEAADAGDETALRIIRQQAEELADTTCALIRQNAEFAESELVESARFSNIHDGSGRRTPALCLRYPCSVS